MVQNALEVSLKQSLTTGVINMRVNFYFNSVLLATVVQVVSLIHVLVIMIVQEIELVLCVGYVNMAIQLLFFPMNV